MKMEVLKVRSPRQTHPGHHGVVEGSKGRRRAKSVSNAIRAPRSAHTLPKAPQGVFSTPRGRDVLLYPDRAGYLLQPRVMQEVHGGLKPYEIDLPLCT